MLMQLVVTTEVVVGKINNMKENKSPVVDVISPKTLNALQDGSVPLELKDANIIPLFKKRFKKQVC